MAGVLTGTDATRRDGFTSAPKAAGRSMDLSYMAPPSQDQEESLDELVAILLGAVPPAAVIKPAMLVILTVQDTQRRTVVRTMRTTDELQDLMDHYLDVVGSADGGAGRFVFDGRRVKREHTPEDLKMENGDQIDYFEDLMCG
ncbi:hypothetical protein BS78_02G363300 [Paspalum vaginatum]|nr:hypothetical protein BS78_02G363300 [Paspalum vaginatum]